MKVFPAVDILNGSCVQLVQGKRETATVYGSPLACAERWLTLGADALHIVNLNGAFGVSRENVDEIHTLLRETGVEMQLGGGIRSREDAEGWLNTGIDRVILSTFAVKSPEVLLSLSDEFGADRIMAGVDARSGQIVVDGWERPAGDYLGWAEKFVSFGAGSLLYTNVNVEGLCKGIEQDPVRALTRRVSVPVTVAGGITTIDDIKTLKGEGTAGIVLGSALYSGKISLSEVLDKAR